ncbi:MAG: M1 family metallopeptidase [Novosphingobium sp.]
MRKTPRAVGMIAFSLALCTPAFARTAATASTTIPPVAPLILPEAPAGKLGDQVAPTAYRLDLTVDPSKERFSGRVEIDANIRQATNQVILHGRALNVRSVRATAQGKTYEGTWYPLADGDTGVIRLGSVMPAGPATFAFDYDAAFGTGPAGMFRVHVGDQWYSWTQHESIDARASFPGFDEPGFKTPFTITLRTPKGLKAVTNAPEVSTQEESGLDVHRFAPTLPLPTYLVAMMVGPFATVESVVPPTPQREQPLPLRVVSPAPNAARISYALENTKPIVALLEDYFGQPFPYPKLDQISSPIMPGAMENAGADLYADNIIVLDDKDSIASKRRFGMVVAHELSHQWFGDLVTPAWWDDIWLNESFANWMGYHIANKWRPDLHIGSGANAEGFVAMETDASIAGRPIHQTITRNSQIDAAFDSITYGKGGHVVAMIAAFMGDTRFRDGVRAYMAAHKYGSATSADFFGAMAQVAGDPRILPAMRSFTDQQGVPLITFARAGNGWKVTQQRYARLGTTAPKTLWGVPLCLAQGKARSCTLLDSAEMTIAAPGKGALMPNAGGTGYYRFELPKADWDALIARANRLSGDEALAAADSLRASYLAGRSSVAQMAALARRLAINPDSHAAGVAFDGLESLRASDLFDDAATKSYRLFVARTCLPLLRALGLNLRAGAYATEVPERTQRRTAVVGALAGSAKNNAVTAQLVSGASAYLGGETAALDPMWYQPALAAWLEGKGTAGAKALFARALATQDSSIRPVLLGTIGSSGDKTIAKWVLDAAKDQRLRASERLGLVRAVISTTGTREMGYDWMKAHLDELMGGAGGIFFASKLPTMLNGFCSVARANTIAADLRPRLAGKTAELELERTIERIRDCGLLNAARKAEASREMAAIR